MSGTISPVNTEVVDGEEIKQYDLPDVGETAFNLDTTKDGYTFEWRVSKDYDVESHLGFLRELEYYLEESDATATVEERGMVSGDLHELHRERGYPEKCTYLRVEEERFDLEWESWEDSNRVMLSAPEDDIHILDEIFRDFYESHQDRLLGSLHRTAFETAKNVIQEDTGRNTLSDFE